MIRLNSEFVNGQEVRLGWGKFLRESQRHPHYLIDGKPFGRVAYGQEPSGNPPPNPVCRDCAAAPGQFHVPGCCIEYCPRCGGQAISCGCFCPFELDWSPFYPIDGELQE
jgi:hypothetical protein